MMKRRKITGLLGLSAIGAAGLAVAPAWAQAGTPVEGHDYKILNPPVPTPAGKIEVVEFFWYACPHCYVFDPALRQWLARLPADASFRREHVAFNALQRPHQRLFYTLEAIGQEARWHEQVLEAFHQQRVNYEDPEGVLKLMASLGADMAKVRQAWDSFGVQSRCAQANRLTQAYNFEGVPALAVGGRFVTAPYMVPDAGDELAQGRRALAIADHLLELARGKA